MAISHSDIDQQFRAAAAHHRRGDLSAAVAGYRAVIAARPDARAARVNLGDALIGLGALEDAVGVLEEAAATAPDDTNTAINLANAYRLCGTLDKAEQTLRQLVERRPYAAEAVCNLGIVLADAGRHAEAIEQLEAALALNPRLPDAHFTLANSRRRTGASDLAEHHYLEAIRLRPDMATAHNNLGSLLKDRSDWAAAEHAFEQAAAIMPDAAEAHYNLGLARQAQGKTDAAAAAFRDALKIEPSAALEFRLATLLPPIPESTRQIVNDRERVLTAIDDLTARGVEIDDPLAACDWTNFYLAYHGLDDRPIAEAAAKFWCRACPDLTVDLVAGRRADAGSDRIRLGLASTFFNDHTIGALFQGVVEEIDRKSFEVHVIQIGPADDKIARAFESAADIYSSVPRDIRSAQEAIAALELDVLLYPDIGMDAATYYLAFARLAPIQMVAWGHPVTTGIPNLDYMLSAADFDEPHAEEHYTERLIRLPDLLLNYRQPNIDSLDLDRRALGFPSSGTVYFCAQSLFKLHPDFDRVLVEILKRDSAAQICLLQGHRENWPRLIRQRLSRTAGEHQDLLARLHFIPNLSRADFVRALAAADVVLDTPHFCGGKTSLECFAAGTALVTMTAPYLRGRLTYGFYRRMGIEDGIAESPEAYVDIAVRLGTDPGHRAAVENRIAARRSCLFDNTASVRAFETVLKDLCHQ